MCTQVTLTDMPDVVMNRILEESDFQAIQTLRKMCHQLRNQINHLKPDPKLSQLHIRIEQQWIRIHFQSYGDESEKSIKYSNHRDGCQVTMQGKSRKLLKNLYFVDVFNMDMKIILESQKSILKKFGIKGMNLRVTEHVLEFTKAILKARKTPLKVEDLHVNASNQSHILSILPFFDPIFIKILSIGEIPGDSDHLEIDEISKLAQWKNAQRLFMAKKIDSKDLESFGHVLEGMVFLEGLPTGEIVKGLKEKFRHPAFKKFTITYKICDNEIQFWPSMGPVYDRYEAMTYPRWYYRIPGSERLLYVWQDLGMQKIFFEVVDESDKLQGAIVQD